MGNNYPGPERRKAQRINYNIILIYSVKTPLKAALAAKDGEVYGMMLDISEKGIAVLTTQNITVGSRLRVRFSLIDYTSRYSDDRIRNMEIEGEVRSSKRTEKKKYRLGINFIKVKEEEKRIIAHFVKKYRQRP